MVCYCEGLPNPKITLSVNLVILQDPREDKQAFSSVRLLEKSIENIRISVTLTIERPKLS